MKQAARETLVAFGDEVVPALRYALENPHEQTWVKRHIPSTLALLPTQASMDALAASIDSTDGFLRYKIIAAMESIRRNNTGLLPPPAAVEARLMRESARYCEALTLRQNLLDHAPAPHDTLVERALGERLERTLDRIYRLMGVLHEVDDIAAARQAIEHSEGRRRAHAIEYLDNLLQGNVRKRIMPLIDETPLPARIDHANLALRTRRRDLYDTLAQLVYDADPVIAAAAVHFVSTQAPGKLTDDLEWVSVHRSSTDPRVSDTAAWALARGTDISDSPAAGRGLPTVEFVERLRRIPIFQFVSVDNLFRAIESSREIRYAAGHSIGGEGATEALDLLIEGSVGYSTLAGGRGDLAAPDVLGLEEVLQGAPATRRTWANEPSVCLRIEAPEFMAMVSDDILLAQGLFRLLLSTAGERNARSPVHRPAVSGPRAALQPLDQAMLLRQHPLLARAAPTELVALVSVARELSLWEGETLFHDEDAASLYLVLEGVVQLESDGVAPLVAGPGATLLVTETLAGLPAGWRASIVRACRILRTERNEVFKVLCHRMDLLQDLFSGALAANGSASVQRNELEAAAAASARQ